MPLVTTSLPALPPPGGRNVHKPPRILRRPCLENVPGLSTKLQRDTGKKITSTRKHTLEKKKKKVRLRLPDETQSRRDRIDPFVNNWLVDTPRFILREKTVVGMGSVLQEELEAFYVDVVHVPEVEYDLAKASVKTMTQHLMKKLKKMELSGGLMITPKPIFVGSMYDSTQVMGMSDIDVLIGFSIHEAKIESIQPGYNIISLPVYKEKDGTIPDEYRFGRSDDGQYLSCRVIAWLFYELIQKVLTNTDAILQPFTIEAGKAQITVLLDEKYYVNLIPAAWCPSLEAHMITRPYIYDENPWSDMMWRLSFAENERQVLQTMGMADRGSRVKVYKIIKSLIQVEHTLHGLTGYHIKTILLHTFDSDVDNTPRWQRGNLEHCFMSILKELQHCLCTKNLPHFFVRGQNLFENMPERMLTNLRNRVTYLVYNPRECIRIVRKRPTLVSNTPSEKGPRDSLVSMASSKTI